MLKRRTFPIFLAILLLATVLRFYQLGKTPVSLEWDEAAIGYDAYSILKTGRDQFGKFLPIFSFRSLDDYKPPIYEYLTVPSVALFGLNEFAVRLPSALSGVLAVASLYWLTYVIFRRIPQFKNHADYIALISSVFLSISPWHLQFSRAAFEVNVSVFITIIAVASFLEGLKKPKFFYLSAVLFGLDLFTYHSARVVAPLLLLSLLIIFNKLLPPRKIFVPFIIILTIFFFSFIPLFTSKEGEIRFSATNIFTPATKYLSDKDIEKDLLNKRLQDEKMGFGQAGRVYHNQRLVYLDFDTINKAFDNYLSHFGFEYLFITGDKHLYHAPGFGLLYVTTLPFLLLGLIYIVLKELNRYSLILPLWLLYAPIPDSVTRDAPLAVRWELVIPVIFIFTAMGLVLFLRLVKKETKFIFIAGIISTTLLISVETSVYLHQYFVHTNYEYSKDWVYGRKEAVSYTESVKGNYNHIIVSPELDWPYIFWLFYTKYPPEKYLKEGGTISAGFASDFNRFDKYVFRNFTNLYEFKGEKVLFVGLANAPDDPGRLPENAQNGRTIYYLNGTPALIMAEVDKVK